MKTYSAAVSKSCSTALAPRKLQTAVQRVTEKDERSKNIAIYGIDGKLNAGIHPRLMKVFSEIGERPPIRVGIRKGGSSRPAKIRLRNSAHVQQVYRDSRKLRTIDGYGSIEIYPDRSIEEREAKKKLVEELR
jgi:hypothetical protein